MTDDVKGIIDGILTDAIMGEPRNMQQRIGPSEIGTECDHCLAAKLAGWEQEPEAAWLPWIGTAFHAYVEKVIEGLPDWMAETRVSVSDEIDGTSDAFHIPTGTVVDWKLVGASTLKSAKKGPSCQYRTQAHSYGLGYFRAGYDVKNVAIYYLPRNSIRMKDGVYWSEPWDITVALKALDRVDNFKKILDSFPSIEERDAWITQLPRSTKCWDCAKFADAPKAAVPDSLEAMLGL